MSTKNRRNRAETEQRILTVTRELLERDGVLAGVNLQEVASLAGVNRALLYFYYGSRQGLLRAALADMAWRRGQVERPYLPFAQRRAAVFREALERTMEIQLAALLALDGAEDLGLFPSLEQARTTLQRDVTEGHLAPDSDFNALHALTSSAYLGYCVFREEMARELEVNVAELDDRVVTTFEEWVQQLSDRPASAPPR